MFCFLSPTNPERQASCYYCTEPVSKVFRGRGLCPEHYTTYATAATIVAAENKPFHKVTWEEMEANAESPLV